ncbi:MAG: hypothetical protein IJT98_08595 [Prevotella sp.]|nr:hypothetical protein [Prevotella sp.]
MSEQTKDTSKEKELSVHKVRSVQAAISDGYRLYWRNFGRIVRGSWPSALLYALSLGLAMAYYFTTVVPGMMTMAAAPQSTLGSLATWAGLMAVYALTIALFICSAGFAPLREHAATDAIGRPAKWWGRWPLSLTGRALVLAIWIAIASAIGIAVIGLIIWGLILAMGTQSSAAPITASITALVLGSVVTLALLPLTITCIDRMMAPRFSLAPPLKGYGKAARQLGRLIVTSLVVWLVASTASALATLPATILTMADMVATTGAMNGDPVDMPQPLFWFFFASFALGGFLQAYIHLSTLFPFYYLWGSGKGDK